MARLWIALLLLTLPVLGCVSVNITPLKVDHYTKVYLYVNVNCPGEVKVLGIFDGFPYLVQGNLTLFGNSFSLTINEQGSYAFAIAFKNLKWLEVKVYFNGNEIYDLAIGKCLGLRTSYSRLDLLYLGYGVPKGVGELEVSITNYCSKPLKVSLDLKVDGKILKEVSVSKCKEYKDIIVSYGKCLAQACYLREVGLTCIKARDVLVKKGREYVPKRACLKWAPKFECVSTYCSQTAYGTNVKRLCTSKTFNQLTSSFTNYLILGPKEYKYMKIYVQDFRMAEIRSDGVDLKVEPKPKPLFYFNMTLDFLFALLMFAVTVALIATL